MTEINTTIIEMLKLGASANEIALATGLSHKQLYYRLNLLQLKGYEYKRKYFEDGEIEYTLKTGFEENLKEISLCTPPESKEIKIVALSDLHLGSSHERLDLLDQIYNFCINKNIHVIANAGDLINSTLGNTQGSNLSINEQIDYAIKNHPFDPNIINFICLGNHDYHAYEQTGQNIEIVLSKRRHDIIPIGYGTGLLHIKNDCLFLRHPDTPSPIETPSLSKGIMITGHTHKSRTIFVNNFTNIYLSSLSNLQIANNQPYEHMPSFVVLNITFHNNLFGNCIVEQFTFIDKKLYKLNETKVNLCYDKSQAKELTYNNQEVRVPWKKKLNLTKK